MDELETGLTTRAAMTSRWRQAQLLVIGFAVAPCPLCAQAPVPVTAMLGCYRLTVPVRANATVPVPAVFRLDAARPVDWLPVLRRIDAAFASQSPNHPAFDTARAFGPWRHALPDPWMRSSRTLWGTAWRVVNVDTLEVKWSDGYTAINLKLRINGDTLSGAILTGSDQAGVERAEAARAWRTSCPTKLSGGDNRR